MAVDRSWLERVRMQNRQQFGMAGMNGIGQGAGSELVAALRRSQQVKVAEEVAKRPPPPVGSAESILQSLPPLEESPQSQPIPKNLIYLGGALAAGLVLIIGISLLRRD